MLKQALAAVALSVGLTAAAAAAEINFGIISTESSTNLRQLWQPVLDDMARQTGYKINAFFAPDYAGVIEGMRLGKVQVAWFGNKSGMEAVDRANGEVFAKTVNPDGTEGYYSHLIVHKSSPIHSLDDVLKHGRSLSFSNGDPNSTSGFLVPGYYVFAKHDIDAKTFFKLTRNANHESNALAVANKHVDIATNNSESLDRIKATQPKKFEEIRVVWTSPLIPSDPLVMRKDLPAAEKAKIKQFFYDYGKNDAREKANLERMQLAGWKPSSDAQLVPIRELALFTQRTKVAADATLGAADKQAKLAEIDARLAALKN